MTRMMLLAASVACTASAAIAVELSREVEVGAPADEVWNDVGGFCAISDWHPAVASCSEEEIDGATHRRLIGTDDAEFLEKRETVDGQRAYGYEIIESPLPVTDYHSTFSVEEAGDGSVIVWWVEFQPEGATEEEAAEIVTGIFDAGLQSIASRYSQ